MNQAEWVAKAKYRGYREIVACHAPGGWLLSGRGEPGEPGQTLPAKRGHNRQFQSLDTALRFLADAGIDEFRVMIPGSGLSS